MAIKDLWPSHGGEYEDNILLVCHIALFRIRLPTFRRNPFTPNFAWRNKTSGEKFRTQELGGRVILHRWFTFFHFPQILSPIFLWSSP
jgi:hypothetical protein